MNREEKIILYSKLINATAVFAGLVAFVLLLNFLQMQKQDPIESGVIAAMVERLDQDPNNEALKLEIRQLDLLARKAYFTSVWQVKTGGFILLFAAMILGLFIKLRSDLKSTIEVPMTNNEEGKSTRKKATSWIWAVGSIILIGALSSAWWTSNQLENYDEFKIAELRASEEAAAVVEDEIEVITLGEPFDTSTTLSNHSAQGPGTNGEQENVPGQPFDSAQGPGTSDENPIIAESEEPSTENREPSTATTSPQSQASTVDGPAHHNAFRGPFSNGVSPAKNIPSDWDIASGKNLIWKVPVPRHGYNSPVIWEDKLFLCGGDNAVREVFCYNSKTGELLWQQEVKDVEGAPATPPKTTSDTGLSAPSATTDGKAVYAMFGTGDVIAFDMNGKRLWAKNMGVPDNHYGHSSSLLVHDNKLIVLYDTNRGSKILALNSKDGSVVWEKPRKNKISWSSPILAKVDGKYQIITTTDPFIAGHDFETGEELWSVECLMGEVGASASYGQGLVFGANEYARLVAIKPGTTPEIVWENDEYLPEVASPVESEGLLFIGTSYGVFACYDALTGEKFWEHEANEGYYASPLIADGKVYATDMGGVMHIFEVNKELKVLAEPSLGEKTTASPAFADGKIYLRGDKSLFCIGEK